MAASDPKGSEKFWDNGAPSSILRKSGNNAGNEQFWEQGHPSDQLIPPSASKSSFFLVFE